MASVYHAASKLENIRTPDPPECPPPLKKLKNHKEFMTSCMDTDVMGDENHVNKVTSVSPNDKEMEEVFESVGSNQDLQDIEEKKSEGLLSDNGGDGKIWCEEKSNMFQNDTNVLDVRLKDDSMKQSASAQSAASKRPVAASATQPSSQCSRFPPREVPPRFMQQMPMKNKQKGRVSGDDLHQWSEAGGAWDKSEEVSSKDSWPSSVDGQTENTTECGPSLGSVSGSVISSSSLSGVQGTSTPLPATLLQATQCSGSSMLGGSGPQSGSNSQHAQLMPAGSATNGQFCDSAGNPNQKPSGAKTLNFSSSESPPTTSLASPSMQPGQHTPQEGWNQPQSSNNGSYGLATQHNYCDSSGAQFSADSCNSGDSGSACSPQNSSYSNWQSGSSGLASNWNIPSNQTMYSSSNNNNFSSNGCKPRSTNANNNNTNGNSSNNSSTGNSGSQNTSLSDSSYDGLIGATGGSDPPPPTSQDISRNGEFAKGRMQSGWGHPPRLGLLGGGESSLNNGTSGWGPPPPASAGNSGWSGNNAGNNGQWGASGRQNGGSAANDYNNHQGETSTGMSPPKPHNSWAQAAGKGLAQSNPSSAAPQVDQGSHSNSAVTKTRVDDHITEIRRAAAFSEGWGQTTINQDSSWDAPTSPQASPKESSNSMWRAPTNTGTEIWENTVRHRSKGGTVPVPAQQQQPWGHTPSTHIGGTWGEDDDASNMWTGVPQTGGTGGGSAGGTVGGGGGGPAVGNSGGIGAGAGGSFNDGSGNTWGNPPPNENKHWGSQSSNWGDAESSTGPDNGTAVWAASNPNPQSKNSNIGTWSPVSTPKKDVAPSGWEEPSPPQVRRPLTNYDDGTAVWGNPMRQGKVSHWKDMPPAKQGSNNNSGGNMPPGPTGPGMIRLPSGTVSGNKEIGTSVWGNKPSLNRNINWNEMPRDPPGPGSWGEDGHPNVQMKNVPGTPSTPGGPLGNSWGEPTSPLASYWGVKQKNASANWSEGQIDTSTWGGPAKQVRHWNGGKPLTKDLIWASKQFRILTDMGFKKDDVENALRINNMNIEDTIMDLQAMNGRESGDMDVNGFPCMRPKPRPSVSDDVGMPDHTLDPSLNPGNFPISGTFPGAPILGTGLGCVQGFKQQGKGTSLNSNTPSLLNNAAIGAQPSSLGVGNSISSLSPALVQKILQQQQQTPPFNPTTPAQNALGGQQGRLGQQYVPSAAQLRTLVQQIQMAVHVGHLNPQILNQPLAPQTLQLLYQLLQQIKVLHQLQQQQQQLLHSPHVNKSSSGGPGSPAPMQLSVQITQTKQRIVNLQNQIAAQQALFLKQQIHNPGVQHTQVHNQPGAGDLFKPSGIDPVVGGLHSEFRDLNLKDSASQPQSRLNQWINKLPSYEKEETVPQTAAPPQSINGGMTNASSSSVGDFSRAPGPVSKTTVTSSISATLSTSHSSPNLHPPLGLADNTWSGIPRSQTDAHGWPDSPATTSSGNNSTSSGNNQGAGAPSTNVSSSGNSCNSTSSEDKESCPAPSSTAATSANSTSQPTYNLSDLVAEFEPGKPWKGTSTMKSVEDDPHMTPGSVTRSPLSLNTIKDTELFNWTSKNSPVTSTTVGDTLVSSLTSFTSSTWAFPPTTPAMPNCGSVPGKHSNPKSHWGPLSSETLPNSDPWGTPMPKPRGPPPGLSSQNKSMPGSWGSGSQTGRHSGWGGNENRSQMNPGWEHNNCTFLVLKNLTPQIDGSTLKTLCMQHGPLQLFHLFLNHGFALVQYSSREEAAKAQSALNNCVLSNTTILAYIPSEAEVQNFLQLAGGQLSTNTMGWPSQVSTSVASTPGFRNSSFQFGSSSTGSTTGATASGTSGRGKLDSTWNGPSLNLPSSHLWSFPGTGNSLWGTPSNLGEHDHGTQSSLNSYLPGDLLSGESI